MRLLRAERVVIEDVGIVAAGVVWPWDLWYAEKCRRKDVEAKRCKGR